MVQWIAVGPTIVGAGDAVWTHEKALLFLGGAGLTALFSYAADLDHAKSYGTSKAPVLHRLTKRFSGGHRMGMHSLLAVAFGFLIGAGLGVLAMAVVPGAPPSTPWVAAWAAGLGWWAGIFCDLLTKDGVGLLYPLTRRRVHLLSMKTSPPKWQRGADGKLPKKPRPMLFGESVFNLLLLLTGLYFAASILAVA